MHFQMSPAQANKFASCLAMDALDYRVVRKVIRAVQQDEPAQLTYLEMCWLEACIYEEEGRDPSEMTLELLAQMDKMGW